MALWLATHDDLANPASADPIARLSTRITCAATSEARRRRGMRHPLQKRPRAGKLPRRRGLLGAEIWPEINWLSGNFTFPRQPGFLAFFPTLEINPKNPLTL
jgi:hypothetical protein